MRVCVCDTCAHAQVCKCVFACVFFSFCNKKIEKESDLCVSVPDSDSDSCLLNRDILRDQGIVIQISDYSISHGTALLAIACRQH